MNGPLAGVNVLDLSRLLPGPAATWYLQGLGASVDRVETPGRGDFTVRMISAARIGRLFMNVKYSHMSPSTRGKRNPDRALTRAQFVDALVHLCIKATDKPVGRVAAAMDYFLTNHVLPGAKFWDLAPEPPRELAPIGALATGPRPETWFQGQALGLE